ncbi:MAG TPA: hypothetical protein VFV75_04000 [Candidatus Polarisedimenticolaceae bacterium]|nr:hypothetical protein [Candidatus Polarisedimenticolaceae bacterium]
MLIIFACLLASRASAAEDVTVSFGGFVAFQEKTSAGQLKAYEAYLLSPNDAQHSISLRVPIGQYDATSVQPTTTLDDNGVGYGVWTFFVQQDGGPSQPGDKVYRTIALDETSVSKSITRDRIKTPSGVNQNDSNLGWCAHMRHIFNSSADNIDSTKLQAIPHLQLALKMGRLQSGFNSYTDSDKKTYDYRSQLWWIGRRKATAVADRVDWILAPNSERGVLLLIDNKKLILKPGATARISVNPNDPSHDPSEIPHFAYYLFLLADSHDPFPYPCDTNEIKCGQERRRGHKGDVHMMAYNPVRCVPAFFP